MIIQNTDNDPGIPCDRRIFDACMFVIDDEEVVTDLLELHLTSFGFTNVHCFNDSLEAIDTLKHIRAEIVLTDVNMPGLGGCYLTQLAKKMEHLREVPVIGITADRSEATRERLLGSGAIEVLQKPIDSQNLFHAVRQALTRKTIPRRASNYNRYGALIR